MAWGSFFAGVAMLLAAEVCAAALFGVWAVRMAAARIAKHFGAADFRGNDHGG